MPWHALRLCISAHHMDPIRLLSMLLWVMLCISSCWMQPWSSFFINGEKYYSCHKLLGLVCLLRIPDLGSHVQPFAYGTKHGRSCRDLSDSSCTRMCLWSFRTLLVQCCMWCMRIAAEDPWVQWTELCKWICRWLQGAYQMKRADLADRCGWQVLLAHIGLLLVMHLLSEICKCMLQAINLMMPAESFLLQHLLYSWLQALVVTRPLCEPDCWIWLTLGAMLMIQVRQGLRPLQHPSLLLWLTLRGLRDRVVRLRRLCHMVPSVLDPVRRRWSPTLRQGSWRAATSTGSLDEEGGRHRTRYFILKGRLHRRVPHLAWSPRLETLRRQLVCWSPPDQLPRNGRTSQGRQQRMNLTRWLLRLRQFPCTVEYRQHLYISPPPWLEEDRESESQFVTDPVIDPGAGREAIEATTSGPAEGSSDSTAPPGGRMLYPDPSTGRLLDLSLDDDDFMPELTSGSGDNSSEDSFMACLDYGFEGGTKD